jgi:hypothetical protein
MGIVSGQSFVAARLGAIADAARLSAGQFIALHGGVSNGMGGGPGEEPVAQRARAAMRSGYERHTVNGTVPPLRKGEHACHDASVYTEKKSDAKEQGD